MTALVLAALLMAAASVAPARSVLRFALVVGYNQAPGPGLPRLRYGDDDAVRWATLLRSFSADVELLTTLDEESQRLYGDQLPTPIEPTRENLVAAMDRLGSAMAAARASGARTIFYFVYAGHGDIENGEGYVAVANGRLYRRDLEEVILARSSAETNHVVVDACRSYYFVYDRGPGGTREPWNSPYFVSGAAARYRNTGFLLASSTDAPTHEWEEFQAGVFSHELRSGLLGAADLDGDGRVSYDELTAFVRVANRPIRNARFRPDFVSRAPGNGDGVFLDLGDALGGAVDVGHQPAARYLLEDDLGVRWADLHPGGPVTLRLPVAPWRPAHFFFRLWGAEEEYRIAAGASVSLSTQPRVAAATLARGAAHEAFAQLFAQPFDESALPRRPADLSVRVRAPTPASPRPRLSLAPIVAGLGIGALVGSATLTAVGLWQRTPSTSGVDRAAFNDRVGTLSTWRTATAVSGVALLAGSGVLYWVQRRAQTAVMVAPVTGGALATVAMPLR